MNKLKQIFISQAFVVLREWPVDGRWERCISAAGGTPDGWHSHRVDKGRTAGQNENASLYV